MELNSDFTQRARRACCTVTLETIADRGVDRRMLDRIGDEVARSRLIRALCAA
jgi:hypothetical protein